MPDGPEIPGNVFGQGPPDRSGLPRPGTEGEGPPAEILRGREYFQITPEEADIIALWDSVGIYDPEGLEEGQDPLDEIVYALTVSMAFREGLKFGHNNYNLEYPEVQRRVQMQLRVPESMVSRPQAYYVEQRIGYELGGRVRNISLYKDRPELWEKKVRNQLTTMTQGRASDEDLRRFVEKEKRNMEILSGNEDLLARRLIALETFSEARRIMDYAFRQRMQTHTSDGAAADLLLNNPFSPDREHMEALFQIDENFGSAVNDSMWFIVDTAFTPDGYTREGVSNLPAVKLKAEDGGIRIQTIGQDFYAQNMSKTTEFLAWNKGLLDIAGGDLNAVKTAWEIALTMELPNEFGKSVGKDGRVFLADPPAGSDLFFWTAHLRAKRLRELGENMDGERTQGEKFISHSGLPLSVDEIGNLMRSYLHNSKIGLTKVDLERFNYVKSKHWSDETVLSEKQELGITDRLVRKIDWLISELQGRLNNPPYKSRGYREDVMDELKKYTDLKKHIVQVQMSPEEWERLSDEERVGKYQPTKVEIPLFDLWYHGRFSMAHNQEHDVNGKKVTVRFPFRLTDVPAQEAELGEAPPATFIGWLIMRRKAFYVLQDIRSRPSLSDLSNPDFFVAESRANPARIRNWSQVLGRVDRTVLEKEIVGGKEMIKWKQPPSERPRTQQLMAWLEYHNSGDQTKVEKDRKERAYRTHNYREQAAQVTIGLEEGAGGAYGDIFKNALNCGWIFPEDMVYIMAELGIKMR